MSEASAAYDVDLFVIGAGSGGVRAARTAANLGARVAVAEDTYLGGTCVNAGCVPKKLLVYGSEFSSHFADAAGFGWQVPTPTFDWNTLRSRKDTEIARLNGIYQRLLETAGVRIIRGRATLAGQNVVEVNGERIRARHILVATGGKPYVPEIPGREHVISSDEAFHLSALPRRALVVGGGYIALEFAGIFNGLGVETTLSHRGATLMRNFDHDVAHFVTQELASSGLNIRSNADVLSVSRQPDGSLLAHFKGGATLEVDLVMYATGRQPRVEGLNLEALGIALGKDGYIQVDAQFRTSAPGVYALGDVIGRVQLTPVALAEGMALARHLFADQPISLNYDNIATAVFCQPNVGTVGLTEEKARQLHQDGVKIFRSSFRPMKNTLSGNDSRMLMKIVVHSKTDLVLGVHVVGPDAGEIVQGFAVALAMGATKADLDRTIGIHPTAAEELVTMREPVTG
ncbi:MAG: glutathione-disulfide reductase [Rubrivivax sp.]|nr:MAG: glutathione-disulfide reductase [Rubrivivax sp.]